MEDLVFIGDWIKDRVLGSGSFGIVVLWKHKRTDEKLAIKTCKWANELTEKHKDRWTKEVEMLQECNNPNIVGTKQLPPEFLVGLQAANPSGLPILCMEYCSGGDLRQVLNKPDSCAGLKEIQIREILSDIRNAMQFLHSNKITHRDLKPENIVMHVQDNLSGSDIGSQHQRKVTYKLIDLGYAKEIDSNSVCASFVGTLQYLAPELLYSKTYSNSVDYWSFGLLAFEIICGTRPFLPFMAPVQWMPHVKKKAHDHICIYETFHGDIEYSSEMFPENHISKPFKIAMEKWLSIALEWDPKLRGRDSPSKVTFNIPTEEKEAASKVVIFNLLESILAKKIIKVFSVSTLFHIAYEIDDTTPVSLLKSWLKNDTKIDISEQILISKTSYINIGDDDLVVKYFSKQQNVMLYLYNRASIIKDSITPVVPKAVQRCLENPKALYNFKNSQNLYKTGLYFVLSEMEIYDSLVNGLFVKAEALKHESKQLLLSHNNVDKNIGQLLAKEDTILKMTNTGKKHIQILREDGTGVNFLGGFESLLQKADDLHDRIFKLQNAWSQLSVRLQSATRRSGALISVDLNNFITKYNYQTIFTNALKAYISYKKSEFFSENRTKEKTCPDIVKVCYECLKMRSQILHELNNQTFIIKLMDLSTEFTKISEIITNASNNTTNLTNDLNSVVNDLTDCMWSTISILSHDADALADMPYSVVSFQKRDFKIGESVSNHCIKVANKVENDQKLKALIEESLKIRQTHSKLSHKVNIQKKLLNGSNFDFSFLNEN